MIESLFGLFEHDVPDPFVIAVGYAKFGEPFVRILNDIVIMAEQAL